MISTDRNMLKEGSAVRARMTEYGNLFAELHIVLFSLRQSDSGSQEKIEIGLHTFVYPTSSAHKLFYMTDAYLIGKKIVASAKKSNDSSSSADQIVVTAQDPFETGLSASWLAKKVAARLHIQVHTDFLSPEFKKIFFLNRIRVFLAGRILPKADVIRTVSKRIQKSVAERYRIPLKKISILPIFTEQKRQQAGINLHAKYPQFEYIILTASRLTKEKNLPLALRVFKKILQNHPKVGLVIVGDGPELSLLMVLAKELEIADSVIFELWVNDLSPYMDSTDLFLSTSFYEGYGLTLMEAVLAGLPVVTSDVGIAPDLAALSPIVSVCSNEDLECFVEKIEQAMKNKVRAPLEISLVPNEMLITDRSEYLQRYKNDIERSFAN